MTITFLFVSVLAVTTAIEPAKSGAINQHISKYAVIEYAAPTLRPNREAARAYVTGRDLAASNQHREAILLRARVRAAGGNVPPAGRKRSGQERMEPDCF